eukprot:14127508-Alexandrium_andersonii.AAC.1
MFHVDGRLQVTLNCGMALAFGAGGRVPPMVLSALGVVHRVRGAPRDARATAVAVEASAWLGPRGWGPEQEVDHLRRQLVSIVRAAQRPLP